MQFKKGAYFIQKEQAESLGSLSRHIRGVRLIPCPSLRPQDMQEQQPERLSEAYVSALEAKYKDAQAKIDILEKLVEEQSHVIETYKVKVGQIYKAVMARKAFEDVRHFPSPYWACILTIHKKQSDVQRDLSSDTQDTLEGSPTNNLLEFEPDIPATQNATPSEPHESDLPPTMPPPRAMSDDSASLKELKKPQRKAPQPPMSPPQSRSPDKSLAGSGDKQADHATKKSPAEDDTSSPISTKNPMPRAGTQIRRREIPFMSSSNPGTKREQRQPLLKVHLLSFSFSFSFSFLCFLLFRSAFFSRSFFRESSDF